VIKHCVAGMVDYVIISPVISRYLAIKRYFTQTESKRAWKTAGCCLYAWRHCG